MRKLRESSACYGNPFGLCVSFLFKRTRLCAAGVRRFAGAMGAAQVNNIDLINLCIDLINLGVRRISIMKPLVTHCLVCSGPVTVERVRCQTCYSALEGTFSLDWLAGLTGEQLQFIRVFVTSHGKIKDVEQALGISYPTVVSRLDDIVNAISHKKGTNAAHSGDVFEQLSRGEIDVDEAERRLRSAEKK